MYRAAVVSAVAIIVTACTHPGPRAPTADDYARHVAALHAHLRDEGLGDLELRVEPPFVLVGDLSPEALADEARTVRWAMDRLERDYFRARPTRIVDVYLLDGPDRYAAGTRVLTGHAPTTSFGFYSSQHGAIILDISTGDGTLVHELVHPYVEADTPDAPPWLDEGLASLFEANADRDGHIVGRVNWRLAALQRAIDDRRVPSLRALTLMDHDTFYDDDDGVHYAASRYLLHYLQERGVLVDYYRLYRARRDRDPTGYLTLWEVLGEPDMISLQRSWEIYVERLHLPET